MSWLQLIEKFEQMYKDEKIQRFLDLIRIIGSIAFFTFVLGSYLFSLGYCFLYGLFIKGGGTGFSLLHMITLPFLFNHHTVSIITILLTLSIAFMVSAVFTFREKHTKSIILVILLFILFHICLSLFFMEGDNLKFRIINFLPVWILPSLLTIMIFWFIRFPLNMWSSFSGSLYFLLISGILLAYTDLSDTYTKLLAPFVVFMGGILFSFVKQSWLNKLRVRTFIYFPYAFTLISLIISLFDWINQNASFTSSRFLILTIICCSVVVSIATSFIPIKIKPIFQEEELKKINKYYYFKKFTSQTKPVKYSFISLSILIFGVLSSYVAVNCGENMRLTLSTQNLSLQSVKILNNSSETLIQGKILSIQNGVYYISDENWNLKIIKADELIID